MVFTVPLVSMNTLENGRAAIAVALSSILTEHVDPLASV
jgi:hypothetical protein